LEFDPEVNQAYGVGLKIKDAYMAGAGLFLLYGRYGQGKSLILKVAAVERPRRWTVGCLRQHERCAR